MGVAYQTIDDLVDLFHPNYVAVENPKKRGIPTPGNTLVRRFKVEYDESDGILMYVWIVRPLGTNPRDLK